MKHVNVFVLAALLGLANVAGATNPIADSHDNNSVNATATANGGKADADATGVGFGGDASNKTDVRNSAKQGQSQTSENYQGINIDTNVEAPDVKGMGRELAKHASSAAEVRSDSKTDMSPCGDSTGLSAQAGVLGGGFATVSETCRAFRLQVLEARTTTPATEDTDAVVPVATRLAEISYFVGWFPRLVLHVASFGVLN